MIHELPKVSVIIPCYNYAHFLPDAVDSVLAQTWKNYEIIIVNDGSQDDTEQTARNIIGKYPDTAITFVSQDNRGVSSARNTGIRYARGEYIQPLDADDMLHPEYLESVIPVLEADPEISFAYPGFILVGEVSESLKAYKVDQEFDFSRLLHQNFIAVCAMFKKTAWEEVGGYKEFIIAGHEDWEFYITLCEAGHKGRFVDKKLYVYRLHGNGRLAAASDRQDEYKCKIELLHPRLYSPRLARISPFIAKQALFMKWKFVKPTAYFFNRNFPAVYKFLIKIYRHILCSR